ncbi:aspartate-semialdehyde dehydrogenase [Pseudomonas sp. 5P_3.1_Bac2]|uniref:aspartate-semialdehyde dehydrogenase n=1 Tax=Pseudomonas sp. 5P_3.1_Bac2 TaxID=2971617 RepID=UPI0021C64E2B|nr:aspartate-semialdehyde dehydrogenase [Pseudomonas sp. 5P_3.1_Bac2]MCU1716011.1 aspartate-semialdehyde dehydrogenase [Pseudomonas sp. 5P_3.1_Bac2]
MSRTVDIAVIGATGSVGETLVQILEERDLAVGTLHLLASGESAGQSLSFHGKTVRVRDLEGFDFGQVQLAFFAAGRKVSGKYVPIAAAKGCAVIDLASGLTSAQAPRVVAEVNPQALASLSKPYVLSSPSAPAVALACVLAALPLELRRITLTACLSVSSRGREAVKELARQTAQLLNAKPLEPQVFDRQIAFNLLAQVEASDEEGHGALERQIAAELQELLAQPELPVAVTCIQAPVFFGDSLSVSLQSAAAVPLNTLRAALDAAPGVELVDADDYPTAVGDAVGQDVVYVGRVRAGLNDPAELNLWIASDNVRKGAALNAVQLAELLIKHYL